MSDTFVVDEVQDSPVVEDGQVEGTDTAEAEDQLVLDFDQYGNYRIPVKVDGEELLVPLSEATAGYQRQADYTRKTQELAAQKQELGWGAAIKAALEADPAGTLDFLAETFQVPRSTPQAPQVPSQPSTDEVDDWLNFDGPAKERAADPRMQAIEARIAEMDRQLRERTEHEEEQRIRGEIQRLQTVYPDFDPPTVIAAALKQGHSDLERAYRTIAFDKVAAANRELAERLAKLEGQRTAKRDASVVSGAASSGGDLSSDGEILSIRDAWNASKRELQK